MSRLIAAALAALALGAAGTASAATHVIDFEDLTPGAVEQLFGTPLGVFYMAGEIVQDADPAVGNYLRATMTLSGAGVLLAKGGVTSGPRTADNRFSHQPFLESFDVYFEPNETGFGRLWSPGWFSIIPTGRWVTIDVNKYITGNARIRLSRAGGRIDNVRYVENWARVPEPATWAMMIIGFGLVGSSLRAKRPNSFGFMRAA